MNAPSRVLIIDNYDSFTHNLYQQVAVHPVEVEVVRNDVISLDEIKRWRPSHVILSPGPGHPAIAKDFGVCGAVIEQLGPQRMPILGVCLGYQGIIERLGGQVVRAPQVVHGKTAQVDHDGKGLFADLPNPMTAMRYHSLIACMESLPECLDITATMACADGSSLLMAVQHKKWPLFGVQFHPESVGTPAGDQLINNFLAIEAYRVDEASS
ncbi:MAG TPA: aminodeoxychorismate/anthranilate synthase component II [Myxococcales bacterium]|nr:aminodeoxychorismate/anthranilate synthase component II [Myxococcales bacterium]HAN31681.1 aminodeoxychorismate/anthranilate synthase component II [Myxococcales bacterium]